MTVRLFCEGKCFGPGVAQLLHRVRERKSLRAAAISMGMAYSKAWTVIKNAEESLGFKLLESTTGGKHGGGAFLSPNAEKLLAAYEDYCALLQAYGEKEFPRLFAEFL